MVDGKVVHEEAVDWDAPGDWLKMDFCSLGEDHPKK